MQRAFVITGLLAGMHAGCWAEEAKIVREAIEWCDIRVMAASQDDLPRVLLIGDSVSKGYFDGVEKELHGKAHLARLATSTALGDPVLLDEVKLVLRQYRFAVIHFNVGLHGWGYTENEYRKSFAELLEVLRKQAPDAKLIWATTTPMRTGAPTFQEFHANNDRVKARNRIAAELVASRKIPTDDLYSLMENHPEFSRDGVHYKGAGVALQVKQVAKCVLDMLVK